MSIRCEGGANRDACVRNDPLNFADPEAAIIAVGGGIAPGGGAEDLLESDGSRAVDRSHLYTGE